MFRKILYGVGGLIGLFIFIAIIAPSPKPSENIAQQDIVVANEEVINDGNQSRESTSLDIKSKEAPTQSTTKQEVSVVPATTNTQFQYYAVTSVVDGDTVKVNINGTVQTLRLIGLDTPETVDPRKPVQCFGTEASNKAKELLIGTEVRIEKHPTQGEFDKYGRTLVYIYREDGLFYNKHMIEQGYAHEYTYNTPYKYQTEFKLAQKSAQENSRGLWSPNTCNGDTTSESTTTTQPAVGQTAGKYYTSSYYTSKYYYPESCTDWKNLSAKYLVSFDTLSDLTAKYQRTLSPQCQ